MWDGIFISISAGYRVSGTWLESKIKNVLAWKVILRGVSRSGQQLVAVPSPLKKWFTGSHFLFLVFPCWEDIGHLWKDRVLLALSLPLSLIISQDGTSEENKTNQIPDIWHIILAQWRRMANKLSLPSGSEWSYLILQSSRLLFWSPLCLNISKPTSLLPHLIKFPSPILKWQHHSP